ncbi:MAG: preprotein translocase subunit SecY [Acidimicrobiia bacterium]|nr:preprotein translocase subunit SecY [Acidimicrobiia bacterium]
MLAVYRHMFTIPDLRRKILFTLFIFFVYRLGATIVVPGINLDRLGELADLADQGGVVGLLNLFSGGGLENFSVLGLGIMPYITASIIMQLLAVVIPRLQALQEEGDNGRKVITQWTRYLTVILALIQSTTISYLAAQGSSLFGGISLIPDYGPGKALLIILTMTAGTSFVMWLGELITQRGVGNGMSLLIFISIISQLPGQFTGIYQFTASAGDWERFAIFIVAFLLMIIAILYVDQGQRRIPIQFAKRVRGRRVMGGGNTYIPIKVNTAGVIPVIFATSVLIFPALLTTLIPSNAGWLESVRDWVNTNFGFGTGSTWTYIIGLFLLIVFFTYFYTAIQFDPAKQADSIQRQGGFIPGVRPGRQTEAHLAHILNRITLPGALFLGAISVIPSILSNFWDIPIGFSGVSVLIVVGVALETMKQIESQLTMRNYEGFLT